MILSKYHQKYADYSDEEIEKRVKEKRDELSFIFKKVALNTSGEVVKIAVLGCGDKRYIKFHKEIFQELITRPVEITTLDITIKHLVGGKNVIKHDCTLPLPNTPYDITYAHVLLKFIKTEKQWDLIKNSYNALKSGGLAILVLDKDDYETKERRLPGGLFAVPLNRWEKRLNELNSEYKEVPLKYGLALIILKK